MNTNSTLERRGADLIHALEAAESTTDMARAAKRGLDRLCAHEAVHGSSPGMDALQTTLAKLVALGAFRDDLGISREQASEATQALVAQFRRQSEAGRMVGR